jgi:hypothetical protein
MKMCVKQLMKVISVIKQIKSELKQELLYM